MYESEKESKDTFGLVIFLIMLGLLCAGLTYEGWQHRNDPPRKTLREMMTEIHQEIVVK